MSDILKTLSKMLTRLVPASKYDVVKRHDATSKLLKDIYTRLDSLGWSFDTTDARFDSVDTRIDSIDKKASLLDDGLRAIDARLNSVEARIEATEFRLGSMGDLLASIDTGVSVVATELRTSFRSSGIVTAMDQENILSILRLLQPQRAADHRKIRLGSAADGGYILLDDYADISAAISLGVGNDDNWDMAVAQTGIPVFQFDSTVERAPSTHPLLHFVRKKIALNTAADAVTIADLVATHSKLGAPDLILKMDVEGAEWDVLDNCCSECLSKFSQIVCEFHGLPRLVEPPFQARAMRVFQKLTRQFCVFHVHANNYGDICNVANIAVPSVLEISFGNRARYSFGPTEETFPTFLDAPNNPNAADIRLGCFRF